MLTISTDWAWHQWDHLYGTFTYDGQPVFGFKSKPSGEPLDTFGRNIYVDTFNSAYGTGWKRENSFLTHTAPASSVTASTRTARGPAGKGNEVPRDDHGPGRHARRDVAGNARPGAYDRDADLVANDAIAQLGDKICRAN